MAGTPEEGVTPESAAPAPAADETKRPGKGGFDWITFFLVLVVVGNIGLFFYNRSRSNRTTPTQPGPPPGAQVAPGPGGPGPGGPGPGGPPPGPGGTPAFGGPPPSPGGSPGAGGPGPGTGPPPPGSEAPGLGGAPVGRPPGAGGPAGGTMPPPPGGPNPPPAAPGAVPPPPTAGPPPASPMPGGPGPGPALTDDPVALEARTARNMLQEVGVQVFSIEELERKAEEARRKGDRAAEAAANQAARDEGRRLLLAHYAALFEAKEGNPPAEEERLRKEGEKLIQDGDLRRGAAKLDEALRLK